MSRRNTLEGKELRRLEREAKDAENALRDSLQAKGRMSACRQCANVRLLDRDGFCYNDKCIAKREDSE